MLAKRIIPCLDIKGNRVVKGTRFAQLRDAGDPGSLAASYAAQGADELALLDISATGENRGTSLAVVSSVASRAFIPLLAGGGVRTLDDIQALLRAGADKVAINTTAVLNPRLITQAAKRFGSQAVVVAIDARRANLDGQMPGATQRNIACRQAAWQVVIRAGSEPTQLDALWWARMVERLGAGEILLTSMDRDGTRLGYDIALTRTIARAVNIPVIASGGASGSASIIAVLREGRADAALAASIFHYDRALPRVKQELKNAGIRVRT